MLEEYAQRLLQGFHPVIVANRAPVEVVKKGSRYIATRGAGGLVSALSTLASSTDAVWVGCARTEADREVAAKHPRSPVRLTGDDGRAPTGWASSPPARRPTSSTTTRSATPCCGSSSTTSGT